MKKLVAYLRLMRVHRPIGALLLLWPTLSALFLAADGMPSARLLAIFIAGTFVMRAAGCVVNDYADRDLDRHVARTRARPLTTGELSVLDAMVCFLILLALAAWLAAQLNALAFALAAPGALLAAAYPFFKRITHLPQLVLGAAFSWGVPMAYAAVTGALPAEMYWFFAANFCWVVAYDTQYAMADREDDIKIGVKSTAILFAQYDNAAVCALQLACLALLVWFGAMRELNVFYYLGLGAAFCFAVHQQMLCRRRRPELYFRAFLNNNWFGAAVFIGAASATLWN